MAEFENQGKLVKWSPDLFPHDPEAAGGKCRFAPTCGGVTLPSGKTTRPDHPTCPNAHAEFAEHTGMDRGDAGFERFIALCRAKADKRYGAQALAAVERE